MKELTTTTEWITPQMAAEYLQRNIGNRKLQKPYVRSYARQMKEGKWKLTGQGISFDTNGNLVDGQHRLTAIIEANMTVPMRVTRGEDVDSFEVYDTGKMRKAADVLSIEGIANSVDISAIVKKYIYLKKGLHNSHFGAEKKPSNQEVLKVYRENEELIEEIFKRANKYRRYTNLLTKSLAGGSMLYLILGCGWDKEYVYGYFDSVNDLGDDIPQARVLRAAVTRARNSRQNETYTQQLIIKSWNYYVIGKEVGILTWSQPREGYLDFVKNDNNIGE